MNRLDTKRRTAIAAALVEGNSIRATARLVGVSKNTVAKLLLDLGRACAEYQDKLLRELPCRRLQVDEIWSFVGAKQKNIPDKRRGEFGIGDCWTFAAICADTKLVPCWLVGTRDGGAATEFLQDLAGRLAYRVQLTTDGHSMYLEAVEDAFGAGIDYAQLVKIYGADPDPEKRYSPAKCIGVKLGHVQGNPDRAAISTSYVERQNLTMRMSMRRLNRLTNAFSKKIENHAAAIALQFAYYNLCRPHQALATPRDNRVTPAMAAGLLRQPLGIEGLVGLLDSRS